MTAAAIDDAWQKIALVTISILDGANDIEFAALTKSIDPDLPEKDIEAEPLVNGGRITIFKPEGMAVLTMECTPMEAGTDTGTAGKGFHDLMHSVDAVVPIRILNDHDRDKYRVLLLWTNDPTPTSAAGITADTYSAYRIGLANGHFTKVKPSFTDGVLRFTVTYKCAPFTKAKKSCILVESCAGSGATDILPAIANYTATCFFD